MQRTAFMLRLQGGRYVYKDNLSGICATCNELGYLVFDKIESIIELNIEDTDLRVC